jgi:hypothetical protein
MQEEYVMAYLYLYMMSRLEGVDSNDFFTFLNELSYEDILNTATEVSEDTYMTYISEIEL